MAATDPRPATTWRHKKTGGVYHVILIYTDEKTMENHVLYQPINMDRFWGRPVAEFMDGRFEEITDNPFSYVGTTPNW
jgi:hypothetical protein